MSCLAVLECAVITFNLYGFGPVTLPQNMSYRASWKNFPQRASAKMLEMGLELLARNWLFRSRDGSNAAHWSRDVQPEVFSVSTQVLFLCTENEKRSSDNFASWSKLNVLEKQKSWRCVLFPPPISLCKFVCLLYLAILFICLKYLRPESIRGIIVKEKKRQTGKKIMNVVGWIKEPIGSCIYIETIIKLLA